MEFRTVVKVPESSDKISHQTPVMFIGSCFASEIGNMAAAGKIPVVVNPHGTLFNPLSVADALRRFAGEYIYSADDLLHYERKYYSTGHYTAFSSDDPQELTDRLNDVNRKAATFLRSASFLFVTFGTSWVFDLKSTNRHVANCHKLPATLFSRRQADVDEIVSVWEKTLDAVQSVNPGIKVWFTVSPVRHLNDGLHGNQLSKARLLLACDQLLSHPVASGYFPSYEMFIDDLRDYRFYAGDMLHPSEAGLEYVWENFTEAFFNKPTKYLWSEAEKITRATRHRLQGDKNAASSFGTTMLGRIGELVRETPYIDFTAEIKYFESLKG